MLRPTVGSGLVISWAGMRGIVSLAAALALPAAFPYRDLIVLTAFTVVLGTLVIQGLTLKPLLRAVALRDDDPVGRELRTARDRAIQAGLASVGGEGSPGAQVVRQEFAGLLAAEPEGPAAGFPARAAYDEMRRDALKAARTPCWRCVTRTRSATTPFISSRKNWIESRWWLSDDEVARPWDSRPVTLAGSRGARR